MDQMYLTEGYVECVAVPKIAVSIGDFMAVILLGEICCIRKVPNSLV